MRVFITGSSGFIGKHVLNLLLKHDHTVLALTRSKKKDGNIEGFLTYIHGDLQDITNLTATVKSFKPDAIIHLAWQGIPDYSKEMSYKNFELSKNLFNMAVEIECKCILTTGSCWEYVERKGILKENDKLESEEYFPKVKNSLRLFGEDLSNKNNILFYWLRLFYVYGPGQKRNSLIPHIIDSLLAGKIPQIQTPYNKNDFIFVEDVAEAIVRVLEHQPLKKIFNVGYGHSLAVKDIIKTICDISHIAFEESTFIKKQTIDIQDFWADINSIQNNIEWKPKFNIESGIRKTIKYFIREKT